MGKEDQDKQYLSICIGCMTEKGSNPLCQHCGYDERDIKQHPLHLKPRIILKKQYLIGRVLGQGGFGITYLGIDLNLYKKVAIKEYLPSSLASREVDISTIAPFKEPAETFYYKGLQSFILEARSVAKFSRNIHIVNVNNYFEDNNTGYMVMDYIEGEPLSDFLKRKGGKLPLDEALKILFTIFDALEAVHLIGIYHRDISPQNIIITREGVPVLIDFGAARYIVGEQSQSLDVILKPGYSPLEQYASKGKIGPWTDIYACGAMFYQMITGKLPRPATDRVYSDDLFQPSDMKGIKISGKLKDVILHALAVKIEDRFQTVSEFKNALSEEKPYDKYKDLLTKTLRDKDVSLDDRISLDCFINDNQLDYDQTVQIEKTLRKEQGMPSMNWVAEYKNNFERYTREYPGGIPRELDDKLRIAYIRSKRISEKKVQKILESLRKTLFRVDKKIIYAAVALTIIAAIIGSVFFFKNGQKQKVALDTLRPSGTINGIKESYMPGETISYTIEAHDDISLRKMLFFVENTSVEKSWDLTGQSADRGYSFTTEGWELGNYSYSLVIEDEAENKIQYSGAFTLDSVQYGYINIWSNPSTDIFIDGKSIGRTPKVMIKVPAGKVAIRLVNKTYNIDKTYNENIAPGKVMSLQ